MFTEIANAAFLLALADTRYEWLLSLKAYEKGAEMRSRAPVDDEEGFSMCPLTAVVRAETGVVADTEDALVVGPEELGLLQKTCCAIMDAADECFPGDTPSLWRLALVHAIRVTNELQDSPR